MDQATNDTMGNGLLQVEDLHKEYRNGSVVTPVLHGIWLTVQRGEFLTIMGPSGCGKSTLLHILGMMSPPTRARSVMIDGIETAAMTERQRTRLRKEKIGFVFQRFNLLPTLTAGQNVRLAMKLRGLHPDGHVEEVFERVGLRDKIDRRPGMLSIGEQQRVAVARAMACQPLVLLADEPTGNLDSANADRILDLLSFYNQSQGQTLILITHDAHLAGRANRVIYMKDGQLDAR
jgi:putative ABC transport system ATP-binding protein